MACSSNCDTQDHQTYGDCLRSKNLQIDRFSLQVSAGGGASPQVMEVRKNHSLERYRQMRADGLEPQSPLKKDLDAVEASLSRPKAVAGRGS